MVATPALETPAFTLSEGTLTREVGGGRSTFTFNAPSKRHFAGGFEAQVNLVLFGADGRFIARRGSDLSKTVLSNRATWTHEFDNDKLTNATKLVYQIQYRFDYWRKLAGGEVPPIAAEAASSEYWRWVAVDPRTVEDRAIALDLSVWLTRSGVEITYAQTPKVTTDSVRSELELELIDGDRNVVVSKTFNASLNNTHPSYDDTSLWVDRKVLQSLRFFELRGRTEMRAIATLAFDTLP